MGNSISCPGIFPAITNGNKAKAAQVKKEEDAKEGSEESKRGAA